MTHFIFLVVEKGPNTKGTLFSKTSLLLTCSDSAEEKDAGGPLPGIPHLVFLQLITRI